MEKEKINLKNLKRIFQKDADSVYVSCNKNYALDLGIHAEEIRGKTDFDFHSKDLAEKYRADDRRIMETGCAEEIEELYVKDGEEFFVKTVKMPLSNGQGRTIGILGVFQDITERRRTEQALKEHQEKIQQYLDLAGVLFIALDTEGKVTLANRKACQVLGYPEQEILGKNWFENFLPERMRAEVIPISKMLLRGEIETAEYFENPVLTRSGEERIISWHNTLVKNKNGTIIGHLSSGEDITDRKRAEEEKQELQRQVLHAQKLESLGVLAGGIAHDFNNLLMVILGNTDLALDKLSPMSSARENIIEVEKATKRAAELAKQMLAYSGKGRFVLEPINSNELILEMAHLLEVSISKMAVLEYELTETPTPFDGDATQVRQIIMNLITNASEAIGNRSGVITLSTGAMDCDRVYLDDVHEVLRAGMDEPLQEGRYSYIQVKDNGCGMDAETCHKIFDPFFTTKFTGRGLGMSVVMGIVRGHNAALKIQSEKGLGAAIRVLFPVSLKMDQSPLTLSTTQTARNLWQGKGTVLIVDDEETVCAVGRHMLERMGFDVLTAFDGREAMKVFQEHMTDIVCVLLDLTMPHMDGGKTFKKMREINPRAKIILSSGYNEQGATKELADQDLAGFLQKPYDMKSLSAKIRSILSTD